MNKKIIALLTTLLWVIQTKVVAAQDLSTLYAPGAAVGGTSVTIGKLVSVLIQDVSLVMGVFAFFVALFAGFGLVTSGGDAKKTKQNSDMLTYALVGIVLSVLAYWLTRILFTVAGQSLF